MRVLIVNTSEKTGGAAVAANRLMEALNNNGVKAKMLVRDKETSDITVVELPKGIWQRWNFLWERWCIFCHMHFSRKHLFEVDIANAGTDITRMREFKEADVIHLSWINQGMLSIKDIRKIIDSGKPVVWTMHDFWPATVYATTPANVTIIRPRDVITVSICPAEALPTTSRQRYGGVRPRCGRRATYSLLRAANGCVQPCAAAGC